MAEAYKNLKLICNLKVNGNIRDLLFSLYWHQANVCMWLVTVLRNVYIFMYVYTCIYNKRLLM